MTYVKCVTSKDGTKKWYWGKKILHRSNGLPAIESANGDKQWLVYGKPHRENDLPAAEYANGFKYWYLDGQIGRKDNFPACESPAGKYWFLNGLLHRDNDLPAFEGIGGSKYWCVNGIRQRENDLPAIITNTGDKYWFYKDKFHRDRDLPACVRIDGSKTWIKNGTAYTYEQIKNYYKIFTRFGRMCLKKIARNKLKRVILIHKELLCMPKKGVFLGGRDYLKVVDHFSHM